MKRDKRDIKNCTNCFPTLKLPSGTEYLILRKQNPNPRQQQQNEQKQKQLNQQNNLKSRLNEHSVQGAIEKSSMIRHNQILFQSVKHI